MSNNIYDIMKKLNAVSEQDAAPVSKQGATLLESTMKEVLNEKYMGFDKTVAAIKKGGSAKDPEAVAASIGRKKYGKEKFQAAAAKGKKLGEDEHMSEDDMEEGNKFTGNLAKTRAAGKKRADLDGDGDMETVREGAKPDYIDLDKDGNRKESMKKAAADKKKRGVAEGKFVKAAGGVPSDRHGNPKIEKPPKDVSVASLKQLEKNKRENPSQSPFRTQDEKVKKYIGLKDQGMEKDSDQELVRRQGSYWDQVAKEKRKEERAARRAKKAKYEETPAGKAEKYWSQKGVAEGTNKSTWVVSYTAERKSYDEKPSSVTDEETIVVASSKEEAIAKVKKMSKVGTNMYGFNARPARKSDGLDSDDIAEQRVTEGTKETSTGRVHKAEPGGYGRKDDEDEEDKDKKKDKKAEPAVKRGRGRPKKDADSDTGEVKKWDTDTLQRWIVGSVPKKLPGKASVKHKIKDEPDDKLDEVAPPGAKAERMVKHIKKGYAKDGKVTPKEKGIAYATAWKAKKAGKVEESIPPGFPRELAKRIYEHYDGDMNSTLTAMWNVHNTVMESKVSGSKKKLSEGMAFEQSTTKPQIKKVETVLKQEVSENKELSDVLKLAGMVEESVKVDECGMSPIGGAYGDSMDNTEGRMNISTNMSTDGNKTVTITADGDAAVDLMKMLKLAGINSDGGEDTDVEKMSEEKDDRYEANTTPEEEVLPVQTQLKGGNGEVAGKEKKMTPHGYKFADNPLAMNESMTLKLMKEYESIKKTK